MVIFPSSTGCRSASIETRENSGSSSRKSTPLCASESSPGFGIAPPTPTWGNMLNGANNSVVIQQYWWRWVFTASIFGICTICINLVGDALRDAVDPKSNGR